MFISPKKVAGMIMGKYLANEDTSLVMWSILSLNRAGAFKKLTDKLRTYKVAIAAVQGQMVWE